MATFLITFFTLLLIVLSAFVVLIILMQKPNANAGMGSALGGGAVEQAFGGNTVNILTRTTIYCIIGFFVIAFGLYLGHLADPSFSASSPSETELGNIASRMVTPAAEESKGDSEVAEPAAAEPIQVSGAESGEPVSVDSLLDE